MRFLITLSQLLASLCFLMLISLQSVFADAAIFPATGVWNGFLNQQNVVECSNYSSKNTQLRLVVKNNLGQVLGQSDLKFNPHQTIHTSLNQFNILDSYGTFTLSALSAGNPPVACHTTFYRNSPVGSDKALSYAYSIPVENPLRGMTSGTYNSMNPKGEVQPIFNWLTIYNPGTKPFNARVEIYDLTGQRDAAASFEVANLLPGDRRDVALGHDRGQFVGLYRIVPKNSLAPYGSFLTRFGMDKTGEFNFSFALRAQQGFCNSGPVPASTMGPAINWAEIANPNSSRASVKFQVFSRDGVALHSSNLDIAPLSQNHIYLNQFLGENNIGYFTVQCSGAKKVLAQSLFYGADVADPTRVEWAYVSQAKGIMPANVDTIVSPFNSFLSASNWLKVFNNSGNAARTELKLFSSVGENISHNFPTSLNGSLDLPIHEVAGSNNFGVSGFQKKTTSALLSAELIRVYPKDDGNIGYIMNVPTYGFSKEELAGVVPSDSSSSSSSSGGGNGGGSDGDDNDDKEVPPPGYSYSLWKSDVQPLLETNCGSCHKGQRFSFTSFDKLGSSFTEKESKLNYEKFAPMISLDNPAQSRLLAKILPATDSASIQHAGGALVANRQDPIYQTLLNWIKAERDTRCIDCGTAATRAFVAYVDQPDWHWAIDRSYPNNNYGIRQGAKIMMQPMNPATMKPSGSPVSFLPDTFCPNNLCDFGNLAANYAGTKLAFECRIPIGGQSWLESNWNICLAEIDTTGKAVNPRFLFPQNLRQSGWTIARSTPFGRYGNDGIFPKYGSFDGQFQVRKKQDFHPIFSADDQRLIISTMRPDPRSGAMSSQTYHGFEHTENIVSYKLDGSDPQILYLNEGGTAGDQTLRKNGNLVIHTWNLERMDRHLYTQASAEGMMEMPVIFGRVQGKNMWGRMVELANRSFIGATGRRRGAQELFSVFYADHTLGTGIDPNFKPFKLFDLESDGEMLEFPYSYCDAPPNGPNCSTTRYYGSPSYSPDGRAIISYNSKRTYYPGDTMNMQQIYTSGKQLFSQLDPYLPEMQVALMHHNGTVETVLTPPKDRSFRYPTWVGKREAPVSQKKVTDESVDWAELHIADFPLWLSMKESNAINKVNVFKRLDTIVSVRVLVKEQEGNACTNDGVVYRGATLYGANGGIVDHPTHLGICNATGFTQLVAPPSAGGDEFGEIPLKADKSIKLKVPAGKLLLLQGVDQDGYVVSQNTRLFTLPPGHKVDTSVKRSQYANQCMSCHGTVDSKVPFKGLQHSASQSAVMDFNTNAASQSPVDLTAGNVSQRVLTFLHQMRPIFNQKCVSCHTGATPGGQLSLSAAYSTTANFPKGKWATTHLALSAEYLASIPPDKRVAGYNWSPTMRSVLGRDEEVTTFVPANDPYKPLGALAPWDSGYQNLFIGSFGDQSRGYYLGSGGHLGRGGRYADKSFLMEVLLGQDLDKDKTYTGRDHTQILTETETRILKALIDNGFPYMSRCDDKIIPSGINAGQPWGQPQEVDAN